MARGVAKPHERQAGHDPGGDEQQSHRPTGGSERGISGALQIQEIRCADGHQQRGLEKQTGNRTNTGFFSEQTVESERNAKRDCEPGEPTVAEREIKHADQGENNRNQLPARQAFAEKRRAEEDAHERRHEITEARFEDASDVYRPDKTEPVHRNRDAARETIQHRPARSRRFAHFRPALLPAQHSDKETGRPDEAMCENLERGNVGKQFPVDRNQSPRAERGDAGDEPGAIIMRDGRVLSRGWHRILFHGSRLTATFIERRGIVLVRPVAMDARKFFSELKRRKVYRVAAGYAVLAWVLIQVATQVLPFFEIPIWGVRLVIVALILGFPVALFLSWAFDLTLGGIVRTEDLDETKAPRRALKLPPPEKSIAVLPFENLSDDQQNTYFGDGIQDDILSNLAKVADLKVISRTSVRQYRTGTRNVREIGEALGVAYVMERTVRRELNRVRINAQLIDARTDLHVWNDSFDREITDLFALQTELARRIAFALRANLSPQEKARLQTHPTSDLDAYDLFLRARDLFRWSGSGDPRENGERALKLLEDAIARDPDFALAHCLASRFHCELYWFGYDRTRSRLAQAKVEADTALRLQPDSSDVRLALAYYYYYGYRDYELARTELAIAHAAAPNDAETWEAAAAIDRRQGRWEDALANFEKAKELDPRNASVLWDVAETYASLGRNDEAEIGFSVGTEVNPDAHFFSIARAAIALRTHGNLEPLRTVLSAIPADFDPGGGVTNIALRVYLTARNYAEAERWLRKSRYDRFNDIGVGGAGAILEGYAFPRSWYEGLIARGRGDNEAAQSSFARAQEIVEDDLVKAPDDAELVAMLGLVEAMRGRNGEAIAAGRRAVELLPISKDAFDGPLIAAKLAVIYGQAGESDQAFELLGELARLPHGPTSRALRLAAEWDPPRGHARFQKLLT